MTGRNRAMLAINSREHLEIDQAKLVLDLRLQIAVIYIRDDDLSASNKTCSFSICVKSCQSPRRPGTDPR